VTPVSELGSAWEAAPAVLVAALLALILFFQGFFRLRRRGRTDHAGWGRAVCFVAGVLLLTLALVSPLDAIGEEYLLSAHMLQHVLIGDAAPALMLVALRGPLLFFFLPAAALAALARSGVARSFVRFVARPVVALSVWATVIAVWHVPALYDYTLSHQLVHDLEHVSFVVAGLLVWYQLVDPARKGVLTRGGRVGFAVLLFAAGQVLSMVLLFSFEPLYPAYAAQPERLLGISALTDQRLAGLVMMFEQAVTLGTCAAFLLLSADQQARAAEEKAALLPEPRS
jgi:cytochrome c oxidase assembly factor CtaG